MLYMIPGQTGLLFLMLSVSTAMEHWLTVDSPVNKPILLKTTEHMALLILLEQLGLIKFVLLKQLLLASHHLNFLHLQIRLESIIQTTVSLVCAKTNWL
jgi:hypothetical protein